MEAEQAASAREQYLTLRVAGEEYAIGILRVREIIRFEGATRVPATPTWIRGVINLRGRVVPVVDLTAKLGLPPAAITPLTCIVIIEAELRGEPVLMGVMADSVDEVIELGPGDVEPPPVFGTRIRVDYLLGMGKTGKRLALILDVDRVLSADEILAMAAVASEAEGAPAGASPDAQSTGKAARRGRGAAGKASRTAD